MLGQPDLAIFVDENTVVEDIQFLSVGADFNYSLPRNFYAALNTDIGRPTESGEYRYEVGVELGLG